MGSFNTMCFASNQVIAPENHCYVIPIYSESSYNPLHLTDSDGAITQAFGATHSTVYTTAFWALFGEFIPCVYADYGNFTRTVTARSTNSLIRLIYNLLKHHVIVAKGENEYHEGAYDLRGFIQEHAPSVIALNMELVAEPTPELELELNKAWVYIWGAAKQHRLFAVDYRGVPRQVEFAVMHKSAYDELFNLRYFPENPEVWLNQRLDDGFARYNTRKAELQQVQLKCGITETSSLMYQASLNFFLEQFISDLQQTVAYQSLRGLDSSATIFTTTLTQAFVQDQMDSVSFKRKLMEHLNDYAVIGGLNQLEIRLHPHVYAGQDYQNATGNAYKQFITTVNTRVTEDNLTWQYGDSALFSVVVDLELATVIENLNDYLNEWDNSYALIKSSNVVDGQLIVQFQAPDRLDALTEALSEMDKGEQLLATLKKIT